MATTFTTMAAALKTRFYLDKNTIPDMTYEESPLYAVIPKSEDWGGNSAEFPIIYGQNQSHSATFSNAQTNAGTLTMKRWSLPTSANKKHYTIAQIPGDLIRAMEGNPNAYFPAVEAEVESAMKTTARRLSIDLFGNGYGRIGVIAAGGISGSTITLTIAEDAKKFETGMVCVLSPSDHANVLDNGGTTITVLSVDEDAGTVTFTAGVVATIAAAAAGDNIFPVGDRQNSATPSLLRMAGLEAWVPYDRTTLTGAFFGVDRTLHPTRLGGSYLDGSQKSLREGIQDMVSLLAGRKAKPKYAYLSFSKWNELAKELGSNVQYVDVKIGETGVVGFTGIRVNGPKGSVEVLPDQACPPNRCYVIQPDTFLLLSLGRAVGFLDEDDNRMLRQGTADSYEIRIGGYVELLCKAPGFNGVINL